MTITTEETTRQAAEIEAALRVFHPGAGAVLELRALHVQGRKAVCRCGGVAELARLAAELDGQGARGCYFTPNPLRAEMKGSAVSARKADVARRHWLLVDIDAVREAGTNATDDELRAAWRVLDAARGILDSVGLAGAVVGCSGNGWHLSYPIDMEADDEAQALLKAVLKGLGERCDTGGARIDPATHDAPRIWKVYGTVARKGPDLPESADAATGEVSPARPWRRAYLVSGEPWDAAAAEGNTEALRQLLARWKRVEDLRRGRPPLDDPKSAARGYALAALKGECEAVESGRVGSGLNDQLAKSAYAVGGYVGDSLGVEEAFEALYAAAQRAGANDPPKDTSTIRRQLQAGAEKPRAGANGHHKANGVHANGKPVPRLNCENSDDPLDRDATAQDLIEAGTTIRWGWEKWLPTGVLTVLASEPGVGKTRFCADLARRVYLGLPWPDGAAASFPAGSRTLWVPADNQHAELGTLPTAFGFPAESLYLNATRRNPFAGTMLDDPEDLREFEARVRRVRPALVFVDTALNATDRSAHKPEDAKAFFVPLQAIAARCGVVLVCVTHLNAAGKPLGRRIMGQARVVMQLEKPDPGQEHRRKLYVVKSNSLYPAPLGVTLGGSGNDYDLNPPESPEEGLKPAGDTKTAAARVWLREQLVGGPKKVGDLRTASEVEGINPRALYAAKSQLGVEEYTADGRKWWRLPAESDAEVASIPFPGDTIPD